MRLEGKKAVVTGGGGGIGRAIVRSFSREGAQVCVVDLSDEVTQGGLDDAGGGGHFALAADVSSEAEAEDIARTAVERMGHVDILVNCHGRGAALVGRPIDRITLDEWNAVFAVNAAGVFLMCRAIAPHMRKRRYGKIINLASLAARRANADVPHYSASKAACMNFTMSFAREMAPYNVNVNAINPGLLWTNIWEKGHGVIIGADTDRPARRVFDEYVEATVPLGREQTPDDVGHMALYLASDESRNVTGQGMVVAGGAWMV